MKKTRKPVKRKHKQFFAKRTKDKKIEKGGINFEDWWEALLLSPGKILKSIKHWKYFTRKNDPTVVVFVGLTYFFQL
jgi:hypothetical protein